MGRRVGPQIDQASAIWLMSFEVVLLVKVSKNLKVDILFSKQHRMLGPST